MRARRIGLVLTLFVGAGVASVAAVPSGGASTIDDVVRLHFAANSQAFTSGTTTQQITLGKNSCSITSAEPLIDLSATSPSSQATPGLAEAGIGVKASRSSSNGTPCSQVDTTETLTLRPGTALAGRSFRKLRLDVELTGNAVAFVKMSNAQTSETHELRTGTNMGTEVAADPVFPYTVVTTTANKIEACTPGSDSGPNAAGNDNCQWTIEPSITFNKIELWTTVGTVSLHGSADFGNNPDFDSLFYLSTTAPVAVGDTVSTNKNTAVTFNVLTNDTDAEGDTLQVESFTPPSNGTLEPGLVAGSFTYTPTTSYTGPDSFTYVATDGTASSNIATVNITVVQTMCSGDTVSDTEGAVVGTFTRLTDSVECKVYQLEADAETDSVLFVPTGAADVVYRGFLKFAAETAPSGDTGLLLRLQYDRDGGPVDPDELEPVEWCDGQTFDSAGRVLTAVLPGDETWCIASESTVGSGPNVVTTWQVYGEDDPRFQ